MKAAAHSLTAPAAARRSGLAPAAPPERAAAAEGLQRLADAAPAVGRLRALQALADAPGPLQRIEGGRKDYDGREVVHPKWGKGVISKRKGQKQYQVDFEGERVGSKTVNAGDLEFAASPAKEKEEAVEGKEEAAEEKESVREGSPSGPETAASAPMTMEPVAAEPSSTATPEVSAIRIAKPDKKKKTWTVAVVLKGSAEPAVTVEMKTGPLKGVFKKLPGASGSDPKVGAYPVPADFELPRELADPLLRSFEQRAREAETERLFEDMRKRRGTGAASETALPQKEIMNRIWAINKAASAPAKGHPSIKMIKIRLLRETMLTVGGAPRKIDHLYTQAGNETEIRCYLGDASGAYQRVHTSLTLDKEMSAHTMVQTGEEIAVPGYRGPGVRTGLDTVEGATPGFASRKPKPRSTTQNTVEGWLKGVDFGKMSKDQQNAVLHVATIFNEALDQALTVLPDPVEGAAMGIDADFKILDDDWLFEGGKAATPEAEYDAERKRRAAAAAAPEPEKGPKDEVD